MNKSKHLDVACGSNPRNPYKYDELYGVDIIDIKETTFNYKKCNIILESLPFEDSSFDSISAYDFLEHIPRLIVLNNETHFPFIEFMNEVYRVLKPNGKFLAITPCYPSPKAFVDPTHVNIITKNTHRYFSIPHLRAKMYGFNGKFKIIRIQKLKFSQETKKQNVAIKTLKNIFYSIFYAKKSHVLWEFKAVK